MKSLLYGVIGLVVVAGSAIGGYFGLRTDQDSVYGLGDQVENFTLMDLNGQPISLTGIAGSQGTVIIFTSNSCPFAKLYDERIVQLQEVYGDMGYPVVLINPSDPSLKPEDAPDQLEKWVSDHRFSGVYLLDTDGLYNKFGATKTPEAIVLDSERKVRYRGAIDDSAVGVSSVSEKYLENAIRALENSETPSPAETRVMGCVIKS